jgi:hypothetical protein
MVAVENSPLLAHFVPIMNLVTYSFESFAAVGALPLAAHFRSLNRPILLKRLVFTYAR